MRDQVACDAAKMCINVKVTASLQWLVCIYLVMVSKHQQWREK